MSADETTLDLSGPVGTADRDDWLAAVEGVLKGKPFDSLVTTTADGIPVAPLYTAADVATGADEAGMPGTAPFVRGAEVAPRPHGAWDVRTVISHPDPAVANRQILQELESGATSIALRFDQAFRSGAAAADAGVDGVAVWSVEDLDRALDGVYLDLAAVELTAGARVEVAARWWAEVCRRRGVGGVEVSGTLGADPLGSLATHGRLPQGLPAALAGMARLTAEAGATPRWRTVRIDTAPHAAAGATAVTELAALVATGAEYLRALDAGGVPPAEAAARIDAALTADADVFTSVAKVRAARRLWSNLLHACGVPPASQGLHLVATTASVMVSRRDPWVNLLRVTAATFAAAVAGADAIVSTPYDAALAATPGDRGRRLARNTQLILAEESHLGRVLDPAGGSWYVESLTDELAERAWAAFVDVEAAGGLAAVLADGSWQARLAEAWTARAARVAQRREPLTGVTEFPDLDEAPPAVEAVDLEAVRAAASQAAAGDPDTAAALGGAATEVTPLPARRLAAEAEALRDAADAATATAGRRPAVFLANLGPVATHTARATFAANAYAVGGLASVGNDGFDDDESMVAAFGASGATVACLCSSDAVYAERAAAAATALRAAGATRVELAGRPGPDERAALHQAGVDAFVGLGTDLIDHLRQLHSALGVTP